MTAVKMSQTLSTKSVAAYFQSLIFLTNYYAALPIDDSITYCPLLIC